ncbi:MAG: type II toxin-antitoxin system antitoxin SocA domain-containing protein, partial [Patescibacteria group bacterium]
RSDVNEGNLYDNLRKVLRESTIGLRPPYRFYRNFVPIEKSVKGMKLELLYEQLLHENFKSLDLSLLCRHDLSEIEKYYSKKNRSIFLLYIEKDKIVGTIALKRQDEDGKKIYKPATHYNLSSFNPDEIDHITKVLDKYGKLSPSELESISHDQQPWMLTENYGDIIDPDLALLIDSGDEPESKIVENDRLKTELEQLANSIAN